MISIIVDDGSEAGSSQICEKFRNQDSRIVYIYTKEMVGMSVRES